MALWYCRLLHCSQLDEAVVGIFYARCGATNGPIANSDMGTPSLGRLMLPYKHDWGLGRYDLVRLISF